VLFDRSPHGTSSARGDGNFVVNSGLCNDKLQILGLLREQRFKRFQRLTISFFSFFESPESLLDIADSLSC
jgi:hypothetical protein